MAASNLPTIYNFRFEDYPGAPPWFAQFLSSLYLFTNPVFQILNGGVAYQNLQSPQFYTQTVTAPATGNTTFNFKNPLAVTPTNIVIGNINEAGKPTAHPAVATSIYWHLSQGTIYVDNVVGLTAATTYVISLVVF